MVWVAPLVEAAGYGWSRLGNCEEATLSYHALLFDVLLSGPERIVSHKESEPQDYHPVPLPVLAFLGIRTDFHESKRLSC